MSEFIKLLMVGKAGHLLILLLQLIMIGSRGLVLSARIQDLFNYILVVGDKMHCIKQQMEEVAG